MAKKYYDSNYSGMDARRAQESSDAGMIPSSRGIANMPQEVVYKQYPAQGYSGTEGLNDTMSGVDKQMKSDMKGKKPSNAEKY